MNFFLLFSIFVNSSEVIKGFSVKPKSALVLKILESNQLNFHTLIHEFKVRVINCKIKFYLNTRRRRQTKPKICQDIMWDFKNVFHNDIVSLENRCRRIHVLNQAIPCFPKIRRD